jgi:hypothetical protein
MKTLLALTTFAMVATSALFVQAEFSEAKMMAEMEKCAMCKHIAANPQLMEKVTWETHKIDNGMLCVSTVPKELKSDFDALSAKMNSTMEQMKTDAAQGEDSELCELCKGMSELTKAGAQEKQIELSNGSIHMLTSDDPAVVAKIHAEADKAIDMQKQLAQK